MEKPQPSQHLHLDQTRDFVQGSPIALLDRLVSVSDFRPGVFSTLVSASPGLADPAGAQPAKIETKVRPGARRETIFPFLDYHLDRLLSNGVAAGLLDPGSLPERAALFKSIFSKLMEGQNRLLDSVEYGTRSRTSQSICRIIISKPADPSLAELNSASGAAWFVSVEPYQPKHESSSPLRLKSLQSIRPAPEIKSTDIGVSRSASESAAQAGADEALLIDGNEKVRECSWSNIFWIDSDGQVWTVGSGVLPGIVRRVLIESQLARCAQNDISVPELLNQAREVFITQSTSGITPIGSIDGTTIGDGLEGPITSSIKDKYEKSRSSFRAGVIGGQASGGRL